MIPLSAIFPQLKRNVRQAVVIPPPALPDPRIDEIDQRLNNALARIVLLEQRTFWTMFKEWLWSFWRSE